MTDEITQNVDTTAQREESEIKAFDMYFSSVLGGLFSISNNERYKTHTVHSAMDITAEAMNLRRKFINNQIKGRIK